MGVGKYLAYDHLVQRWIHKMPLVTQFADPLVIMSSNPG
jgi:hypothetical protein